MGDSDGTPPTVANIGDLEVMRCGDCGALLTDMSAECPRCSAQSMADRAAAAMVVIEKQEEIVTQAKQASRSTGFKSLETVQRGLLKMWRRLIARQKEIQEIIADPKLTVKERTVHYKLESALAKDASMIADKINKNSKEMLAYQEARSRIVDSMTPEQQNAEIMRHFRKLPDTLQIMLVQELTRIYNECRSLRTARAAKKIAARKKLLDTPS